MTAFARCTFYLIPKPHVQISEALLKPHLSVATVCLLLLLHSEVGPSCQPGSPRLRLDGHEPRLGAVVGCRRVSTARAEAVLRVEAWECSPSIDSHVSFVACKHLSPGRTEERCLVLLIQASSYHRAMSTGVELNRYLCLHCPLPRFLHLHARCTYSLEGRATSHCTHDGLLFAKVFCTLMRGY